MATLNDQGLREVLGGLASAQAVLRRRKANLEMSLSGIESEIAELRKIETAVAMAVEVLRGAAEAASPQGST